MAMRYFYATLSLVTVVLLLTRSELSFEIITTMLVIAGIVMLLPTE